MYTIILKLVSFMLSNAVKNMTLESNILNGNGNVPNSLYTCRHFS